LIETTYRLTRGSPSQTRPNHRKPRVQRCARDGRRPPLGSTIVNVVLPLFGILFAGYAAGRFGLFNEASSAILNRFVFVISFPALIIVSLSRVPVDQFFDWPFLGALGGGMAATYALSMVIARFAFPGSLAQLGMHGLTAMYSSTGYIGLPLLLIAFGDAALVPGIIGSVITGAIFMPIAIILVEISKGRDQGTINFAPLVNVVRNPVFVATGLGLLISAMGLTLPVPIATMGDLLGGAYTPCALFAAGLFMATCTVKGDMREVSWLVCVKLAIHPLITAWLAYGVFGLEGILPAIVVIQAALPCGGPVFVLAQHYNIFAARSNAVVVISTALSVITLTALLALLGV